MTPACRWLFALLLLFTASLCVLAGCTKPAAPPPAQATVAPAILTSTFVGSAACAGCHPDEWQRHRQTGHAHTLRLMRPEVLGADAPPSGSILKTDLAIQKADDAYVVRNPLTHSYYPLTLAFGSGKLGMTYATVLNDTTLFEMHYSYFPGTHLWYITPGHEHSLSDRKALGISFASGISRPCILCHAVTLPEQSLNPDPKFLGIGCESCHGPGSAHIAAVQKSGAKNLGMEDLSHLGGKQMNALCGKCHRTVESVEKMPENQRLSQRFFPYGLAMSRCFQESEDRLTCSTCHNPHDNPQTDQKFYESRCLSCHTAAATQNSHATSGAGKSPRVCKVNPRKGCIPCHMPKRTAFPGTALPIQMADHWIRIHPK